MNKLIIYCYVFPMKWVLERHVPTRSPTGGWHGWFYINPALPACQVSCCQNNVALSELVLLPGCGISEIPLSIFYRPHKWKASAHVRPQKMRTTGMFQRPRRTFFQHHSQALCMLLFLICQLLIAQPVIATALGEAAIFYRGLAYRADNMKRNLLAFSFI